MADDNLEFTISWQGASKARLHYLIDNDAVVATEDNGLEGNSPITYSYSAAAEAIHAIEWSLWFPGATIKGLVAKVSINGGDAVTLDARKDEAKSKWASRGGAP
jgi:hypothetical protein